ncbi:MAG: methyltransferase domain-containing protein [Bacteroidota bacterium]
MQVYNEDADLGLGCGIPTDHPSLQKGDVVLDLGSGAGNDCFVARSFVGEQGFVYGIDFSKEIHKEKEIVIPDEILEGYLNKDEVKNFNESQTGIYSITIRAKKEIK